MKMRKYQKEGINEITDSFNGFQRVLYQLPTGGGKSVVMKYLINKIVESGHSVCVMAHTENIVLQLSDHLKSLDIKHGIIKSGFTQIRYPVQVASVQTLINRVQYFPHFDFLFVDETHHIRSRTYERLISFYKKSYLLGVTATPQRLDGKGLGDIFQHIVKGPQIYDLIEDGYLSDFLYCKPKQYNLDGARITAGDFNRADLEKILGGQSAIIGDAVKEYKKRCNGKPAVTFCVSIKHAEEVCQQFNEAGIKSKVLHSKLTIDEQRKAVKDLAFGYIKNLISVDMISEGFDIPKITAALLLRPTWSESLYLQQAGRALRPIYPKGFNTEEHTATERIEAQYKAGKPKAIIMDFVGSYLRHGFPDDHREWGLEKTKQKRKKKTEENERVLQVYECKCGVLTKRSAGYCRGCGAKMEVQEREIKKYEGDLEETNTNRDQRKKHHYLIAEINEKASNIEEARRLSEEYGYKAGYADRIWKYVLKKDKQIMKADELMKLFT